MRSLRKKWVLFGIAIVVALILIGTFRFRHYFAQDRQLSAPIKRGTIVESVYGIGTVRASKTFDLKPGVPTSIERIYVKEGDRVKKGYPLVLSGEGNRVVAPFSGTVVWVPYNVGETIFPQMVVVRIVDLKDRYIVASLEQRAAVKVKSGQKALVSFEGFRDDVFDGVVEGIYSNENSFNVRIQVSKMPDQILPGMTADVAISIRERQNVLVVPVAAIQNGRVEVRGKRWRRSVPVTTGVVDGAMAEILSGDLREGDQLYLPEGKVQ